jgi:hypothetical protein
MKKTTFKIENLLNSFPNDREEIFLYMDKVKKYSSECGCSMGAKFLMVSIGIFLIYFFRSNDFGVANLLKEFLLGILFIFTSSIIGKLIGIGIARLRLVLLSKYLIRKYRVLGE